MLKEKAFTDGVEDNNDQNKKGFDPLRPSKK